MNAKFTEIHAAADYIGPGAIEVPLYQSEITDLVRRRGIFGQRIKQVPATGHPSRYFEETAIPSPAATSGFVDPRNIVAPVVSPTRVERSVPLKALVAQINYNLFDIELAVSRASLLICRRRTSRTLWMEFCGRMMSLFGTARIPALARLLRRSTLAQARRLLRAAIRRLIGTGQSIVDGFKSTIAQMIANSSYGVRPTAIYANPVLLDLIDREMKTEFNVVLNTKEIAAGLSVKTLSTQAGDIPLIPEWTLSYTGTPGSGSAVLPAYIVTEDLIEYHWLSDPHPRIFQLGVPGSLASQYVVVKFGGVVVKGANYAHYQVLVDR